MNLLDFLKSVKQIDGLTIVSKDAEKFLTNIIMNVNETKQLIGKDLAISLFESAQPEIDRITAIINRARPGIDYHISQASTDDELKMFDEYEKSNFWGTGAITKFIDKGQQKFAYDDHHAYDISRILWHSEEDDTVLLVAPSINYNNENDEGPFIRFAWPDEGRSGGLASTIYLDKPNKISKPSFTFYKYGYIYTHELGLTAEQIAENIIDEVDRGETPLTGGRLPGWV